MRVFVNADSDIAHGSAAHNGHASAAPQPNAAAGQNGSYNIQPEAGSSPDADHGRPDRQAFHSRRVSWDDTLLETAAGGGSLDTGTLSCMFWYCRQNMQTLHIAALVLAGLTAFTVFFW